MKGEVKKPSGLHVRELSAEGVHGGGRQREVGGCSKWGWWRVGMKICMGHMKDSSTDGVNVFVWWMVSATSARHPR